MCIDKIMFISPTVGGGGAERVVSVLSSTMAERGIKVVLVLYERLENEYPLSPKIDIHLLPKRKAGQTQFAYLFKKFFYLRSLIKKENPNYIIPFLPFQVIQCFFVTLGLGIPMAVTVRADPNSDMPNKGMELLRKIICYCSKGIFLQTESQRSYFDKHLQKKCFVVPNPVSASILETIRQPKPSISKIVSVGRLEKQKNYDMLIHAFSKLDVQEHLQLDIYGEGSEKEHLQSLIHQLKLDKQVRLMGRTNHIAETLCCYDLFVLASNFEGMPNALMEAMGVGLPCISTNCPTGPAELLRNGMYGQLISVGATDELAQAIRGAIEHHEEVQAKAQEGKEYIIENYSPNAVVNKLLFELEKSIAGKAYHDRRTQD